MRDNKRVDDDGGDNDGGDDDGVVRNRRRGFLNILNTSPITFPRQFIIFLTQSSSSSSSPSRFFASLAYFCAFASTSKRSRSILSYNDCGTLPIST